MATSYQLLSLNTAGPYRRARLAGRDYLVAPLTSIVPGVLHGSQGPLYYPPAEVATNVRSWDDTPLTLYHPEDPRTGAPAHAGAAGVLERQGIGFVRGSVYNGRLRHEAWFDLGRLRRAESARALGNPGYPAVLPRLLRGEPVEVSTGLYTDNLPAPRGYLDHQGRPYSGLVARNYRPDHMAVLPDQRGACSLADGCGVGVTNAAGQPRDKAGRFAATAEKASAEAHKRGTVGHHEKAHAAHTKAAEAYAAQETHEGNLKAIYHLERAQEHAPKPAMTMADLIAKDKERAEMVNRTRGFTQNEAGGDGAAYTVNPFVSEAQRRACHAADDPAWDCDEWEAHTPDRKLPERKPGTRNAARPAAGKGPATKSQAPVPAGPLEQGDAKPRAADGKFSAHGEDAAAADPDDVVAEAGAAAMTARVPGPGRRATRNADDKDCKT